MRALAYVTDGWEITILASHCQAGKQRTKSYLLPSALIITLEELIKISHQGIDHLFKRGEELEANLQRVDKAEFDSVQEEELRITKLIADDIANSASQILDRMEHSDSISA